MFRVLYVLYIMVMFLSTSRRFVVLIEITFIRLSRIAAGKNGIKSPRKGVQPHAVKKRPLLFFAYYVLIKSAQGYYVPCAGNRYGGLIAYTLYV